MKRRALLKFLSVAPTARGLLAGSLSADTAKAAPPPSLPHNLFEELGINPIINARGTMTYLSGSLMMPEVLAAIQATAHQFADMHQVQDKVGEKIAQLLHCQAAMVTSGAACALTIGTAGVLTGTDPEKIRQLPNLPGPAREVIIQKSHRYVFDQAVRSTGIKFVEVEGPQAMRQAINEQTVMALFFNGAVSWYGTPDSITHEEFVGIAKQANIPTFIDAAADVPPVENLFKYQRMGFDLVTFSGGKMIRGPQSAGLLFGRKDLIEAAKLNFSPHECPIGRSMKVNKEEIFGMYVALKSYLERDHAKDWQQWVERTSRIAAIVSSVPTVKGQMQMETGPANAFPGLTISWDGNRVKISPEQVAQALRSGKPSIEIGSSKAGLQVSVVTLQAGEVEVVGQRVKEILAKAVA